MENPIEMDEKIGGTPIFQKPPYDMDDHRPYIQFWPWRTCDFGQTGAQDQRDATSYVFEKSS